MTTRLLIVVVSLMLFSSPIFAKEVPSNLLNSGESIGHSTELFEDSLGSLKIKDILTYIVAI